MFMRIIVKVLMAHLEYYRNSKYLNYNHIILRQLYNYKTIY